MAPRLRVTRYANHRIGEYLSHLVVADGMAETLGRRIYALKLRYRIIGLVIESQKK